MSEDPAATPAEPLGRRDANKRATRSALEAAAQALFAERGFAATTVRDIADAAGVTERTFFRYFEGKEELILDDVLDGLPKLQQAIRDRPAEEPPLTAVHHAVKQLVATAEPGTSRALWLFLDGPPGQRLGTAWRGFLLRIESGLADAITDRLTARNGAHSETAEIGGTGESDHDHDHGELRFKAEVAARISLAVFRSVLIRDSQLREIAGADPAATLAAATRTPAHSTTRHAPRADAHSTQTDDAASDASRRAVLNRLFEQAFAMVGQNPEARDSGSRAIEKLTAPALDG